MILKQAFLIIITLFVWSCSGADSSNEVKVVKTGAQVLIENHLDEMSNKKIGLVMNPTARIKGVHVLDTLMSRGVNVTALYAPEHGFRGDFSDGELIRDGVDVEYGLPVYSLYGETKIPTGAMLENIDILIFDMQDVGARFYTYNTTMKNVIEAAAVHGKEVWILDRPNPVGGEYVSGWVIEDEFASMVGSHPIPVAHGLTLGELALMGIGEGWYSNVEDARVKVIKMEGWNRGMLWPDTGLPWIPPSPNLPTFEHAHVYLGTCFIEGINVSEGRGTNDPFLTIGGLDLNIPIIKLNALAQTYHLKIDTLQFTPVSIPGKSRFPKFENERLNGISIQTTTEFSEPVEFGLSLLEILKEENPQIKARRHLYLLAGTAKIDSAYYDFNWGETFDRYLQQREKYLLY